MMKGYMKAQLEYDAMMPDDNDRPPHRFSGEVIGKGYVFTLEDGEFISVSDGENTISFYDWSGPNEAVEIADRQAERIYIEEVKYAGL